MSFQYSTHTRFAAPWHKQSFDRFLNERLPALLAERVPLAGYAVQMQSAYTCRITLELANADQTVAVEYLNLPQPDAQGLFDLGGEAYIVVPTASDERLDQAVMACAGEQLYHYIRQRQGQPPQGMAWDESVARAFLPLEAWFNDFLHTTAQRLDDTNWHARHTHLRRIIIPNRQQVIVPGQMGRVDPFETPEGPNIGRVFTVALGAEIRDERLVITEEGPVAALGPNSVMVPFIENNDANRLLMGVNMMRQGLIPAQAEPALVQTGGEPDYDGPDLWCGRNLLTAFMAWGEGSTEDGLILSETCAQQRFNYPYPAEPGDKLANRHGTKGVVSQVLPDAQMPHLADGTPVEIIFSFTGIHNRGNFSQVLEALMGRIAHTEGQPAIVPAFQAPSRAALHERLVKNGLPESGMERLWVGQRELTYPTTVGYVYWYRLAHLAADKLRVIGGQPGPGSDQPIASDQGPAPVFVPWRNGQVLGDMEIDMLRQAGALVTAREALTTRAAGFDHDAAMRNEPVLSPYIQRLTQRLGAAGIALQVQGREVRLRFQAPAPEAALHLVRRMPHPWLREQRVAWVGHPPADLANEPARQAFAALASTNDRLKRWLSADNPGASAVKDEDPEVMGRKSTYLRGLFEQLETRLAAYFDALLPPDALHVNQRQMYSGRAVIAPGVGLRLDQVGLPETIAQTLFGEMAALAKAPIDKVMARSWVIIHRAPALTPTALIAFHPVRVSGPSIRLHPQTCALLNADFDGDQVAVYLPISAEAQREAGEKLSIAGHLKRNPELVGELLPPHEGIWGLAYLSLSEAGRAQIASTLGMTDRPIGAPVSQADLALALREVLDLEGIDAAMRAANALAHLGYAAADASGASISPFSTSQVPLPPAPTREDVSDPLVASEWEAYVEACAEAVLSSRDYTNPNLGPQLLSAAVRPRSRRSLPMLVGPRGIAINASGKPVIERHGTAEGRTPEELYASVAGARMGLARLAVEGERILQESSLPGGAVTLLARARRSKRPGLVFARAAASGEVDPLTDVESRILVGVG